MDKETLKILAPVLVAFFSFLGILFSRGRPVPGGESEGGSGGGRSLFFVGTLVTSLLAGAGINLPKWLGKPADAAAPAAAAKADSEQADRDPADREPGPPSARGQRRTADREADQDPHEPRPARASRAGGRAPVPPPPPPARPPAPRDDDDGGGGGGYSVGVKPASPRISHGDD